MDKFILGENHMRDAKSRDLFIIHLLNPIAIFQAHLGTVEVKNKIFKHYQFLNNDGKIVEWTLSTHHFFTTNFVSDPKDQVIPLMDKAWRWYRSYLNWEDNNLDLQNEPDLN